MKKCTKCGIEKELNDFYYDKIREYYLAKCKICRNIKSKEYYKNNKKKRIQQTKQWRQENPEKTREYSKQYYKNNKEKVDQKHKQYYGDNKEKITQRHKQYNKDNKEQIKEYEKQWQKANPEKARAKSRKRRVWELELNENFTLEQEVFILDQFNHKCFNCESTEKLHIDHHRALSKGNPLTLRNAVVLCNSCNCSKCAKDPEEFYGSKICEKLDKRLVIIDIMYCVLVSKQKEAEAQSNAKE